MAEIKLTNANFEAEVLNSDKPVLIDFWASWCGPCKMLAPIIAQIANEYAGKVKVCKVNVDEEPELASEFHISSIPTLYVIKDRAVTNKAVGYMSKDEIVKLL